MNKIKDFVAGYFGYFLVAFFFEWLTEKITGWLFDWTPAGNPILLGVISAVFAISALSVYMDENDDL